MGVKRRTRYIAEQWELPIADAPPRNQVTLPPRGTMIRIAGAPTDINGVWKITSAMTIPGGGIFLGLENPELPKVKLPARAPLNQQELFV